MAFMPPFGPPGGPQTPPFTPPFGPPGGQQPPSFAPPFGPQGGLQPPAAPPPLNVPPRPLTAATFAIDPGAISGCLFRNTYIWPRRGPGFWFFPVFVGRTSVAGFRWNGRFWMFSGFDLRSIESFTCF
ncbi:transporter [Cohnella lubricantis]|uniref:Transporter n=1 Tax=Cohnella lubricantis TaxID=2163172 RepID=A0A841TGE2_9BACL|nr:transporter [Cohnella lubricantis]MBB6678017.1 transporter [Cohnella lubricantis]MBP2118148.1 hypothetical protein [Cohnella lubricantis]